MHSIFAESFFYIERVNNFSWLAYCRLIFPMRLLLIFYHVGIRATTCCQRAPSGVEHAREYQRKSNNNKFGTHILTMRKLQWAKLMPVGKRKSDVYEFRLLNSLYVFLMHAKQCTTVG